MSMRVVAWQDRIENFGYNILFEPFRKIVGENFMTPVISDS